MLPEKAAKFLLDNNDPKCIVCLQPISSLEHIFEDIHVFNTISGLKQIYYYHCTKSQQTESYSWKRPCEHPCMRCGRNTEDTRWQIENTPLKINGQRYCLFCVRSYLLNDLDPVIESVLKFLLDDYLDKARSENEDD